MSTCSASIKVSFPCLGHHGSLSARTKPSHELLHALRLASDKCGDQVFTTSRKMLASIAEAHKDMLPPSVSRAYEDPDLVGGGVTALDKLLHKRLRYCGSDCTKNGKLVCGRLIPEDYDGLFCPNIDCKHKISPFIDHVIDLSQLYPLLMEHSDLLQRIADYSKISKARLSQPLNDPDARVWCTESGRIARGDFHANPKNFILDIVPRMGEQAFFDDGGGKLQICTVIEAVGEESETGLYTITLENGQNVDLWDENRSKVHKIGGTVPINVVTFDDGAEVFKSSSYTYSNCSRTEEIKNIAEQHRRREIFCSLLGTSSGGCSHANTQQRLVFYEKQRRRLATQGTRYNGSLSVDYCGRTVTVHNFTIKRNEIVRVLDHPEVAKQGTMGLRNPNSAKAFLSGFEAASTSRRTLYSLLLNIGTSTPTTETESVMLFQKAEKLLGTAEWLPHAKATGVKGMSIAERGDDRHQLPPDPTQTHWSRISMGKMHFDGIRDNDFRKLLTAAAPVQARRVLSAAPTALRQPPGTKKLHSYVKIDPKDNTAKFTKVDEKLHQKKKWRETLMLYDLYPLFTGDSEKSKHMRRVCFCQTNSEHPTLLRTNRCTICF